MPTVLLRSPFISNFFPALLLLPAEGVRGAVQARQEAAEASDLQTPEVRDTSSLRRRRIRRRGSSW